MSLISRALEEYQLVNGLNNTKPVRCPPPPVVSPFKRFSFSEGDQELAVVPVHEIELRREKHRRATWGGEDFSLTRGEFVDMLRVDRDMTRDPQDGVSVLDICPGKRAYDGDPIEESYRALKYALGPVNADPDWVKRRNILAEDVAVDFARLKWAEEEADRKTLAIRSSSEVDLVMPPYTDIAEEAPQANTAAAILPPPTATADGTLASEGDGIQPDDSGATSPEVPGRPQASTSGAIHSEEDGDDDQRSHSLVPSEYSSSTRSPSVRPTPLECILPREKRCHQHRPLTNVRQRFLSDYAKKKEFGELARMKAAVQQGY